MAARTGHGLAPQVINKFYGTYGPNYRKANADLRSCE